MDCNNQKVIFVPNLKTTAMKTKKKAVKKEQSFVELLSIVLPRENGTQAGVNALAASILRGKELTK